MEEHPFPELNIAPFDFLDACESRRECPKCGKSRKYYCYSCYVPVKGTDDKVPRVKLPLAVDIIKHPGEVDGKSTASHAGVLAPDSVNIYTYPAIPDYSDKSRVILIFPGENSVTLEELAKHCVPLTKSCSPDTSRPSEPSSTLESNEIHADKPSGDEKIKESELNSLTGRLIQEKMPSDEQENVMSTISQQENSTSVESCNPVKPDVSPRLRISQRKHSRSQDNADEEEPLPKKTREPSAPVLLEVKEMRKNMVYQCPFDKVVFIDSTWNQTNKIFIDERLKGLKQVELKTRLTKFWRHQRDKPSTYLATIEAVYYFLRDYHEYFVEEDYSGQYDNLLFFFCFMYQKIRKLYDGGKELKAYQNTQKSTEKTN